MPSSNPYTKIAVRLVAIVACAVLLASGLSAVAAAAAPEVVTIEAGAFITGSDRAEREAAYMLDKKAYGHSATREQKWYESEPKRKSVTLPAYDITRAPITNDDYAVFIAATGHKAPDVTARLWESYGLVHPYKRTRRHAWSGGAPPSGRGRHPVVLVAIADAMAYASWLSETTAYNWRLPSETEWEKAARGSDGRRFPWGDAFDPKKLNSHDSGPFDTTAVDAYKAGAGPFGLLDAAGNVFEWTATADGGGRHIVKGGSWDDKGCGVCRPAARHSRPDALKHILLGFRLVREARP